VACAWLQIPRVFNPVIAFFLALSLIVVEVFLHVREQDA
jgi:predicted nucleic acid-binding Zn ribbon protein